MEHMRRYGFQSTLPARGSDLDDGDYLAAKMYISIHAPRKGERHGRPDPRSGRAVFQSTLPARGSDDATAPLVIVSIIFQSTLPARGSDGWA